ncbi:putative aldehyde dehydrogenase MIS1 [Zea mays]|uniref:Putative aldehyde dehydrogenase MIS1 n=1 Tax=Zea mays TaxID=4577 RepID=A0A1D6MB75_MAIZE|nr:putative aldehyde dehydrogenase MIS1 [Zea mays]
MHVLLSVNELRKLFKILQCPLAYFKWKSKHSVSLLFICCIICFHLQNWSSSGLLEKMKKLSERRKLEDLTIGPVLTVTTEAMIEHMNNLLKIRGSKVLFGGEPLANHSIPKIYGAMKPTAVFVPLEEILKSGNFELVTKEIFGPFQVIDPRCNYVTIMKIIQ